MAPVACALGNLIWRRLCRAEDARFGRCLDDCQGTQAAVLDTLLRRNEGCRFGSEHGFAGIRSARDYQRRVPLSEHSDYQAYIDAIAAGRPAVLTAQAVDLFEPTSGTAAARKLVPYTRELRDEFRRAVAPWVASLHREFPGIHSGPAYWSLSPPVQKPDSHGIVPVGFDNDWQYLGLAGRLLYAQVAVRPRWPEQGAVDAARFRTATLAALLEARDLSFISVWSPSFLTILLSWYMDHPHEVLESMTSRRRVAELRAYGFTADAFARIWPRLRVISCWTDGASGREARSLRTLMPEVPVQGKGLVATEAVVSIPYATRCDPVLALTSHFFEFLTADGEALMAHELQKDECYSVVVTTGGGLYRYRLHDRVLATGHLGTTPCLRFLVKDNLVSDLRGEKLHAEHVARCIERIVRSTATSFAMLAPDRSSGEPRYTLYLQAPEPLPDDAEHELEAGLQENPQYRSCAQLGQLEPARVFSISHGAREDFEEQLVRRGMRRGDIKATPLSSFDDWSSVFSGSYVSGATGRYS